MKHGLDEWIVQMQVADTDGDGLTNGEEIVAGTTE